jgi:hypothetical protein
MCAPGSTETRLNKSCKRFRRRPGTEYRGKSIPLLDIRHRPVKPGLLPGAPLTGVPVWRESRQPESLLREPVYTWQLAIFGTCLGYGKS